MQCIVLKSEQGKLFYSYMAIHGGGLVDFLGAIIIWLEVLVVGKIAQTHTPHGKSVNLDCFISIPSIDHLFLRQQLYSPSGDTIW